MQKQTISFKHGDTEVKMSKGDYNSGYVGIKTTKTYTYEGEMDRNGSEMGKGVRTFTATGEKQEG